MMNLDDTARVLRVLAGSTGRTVGKADVLVWANALSGRDPDECIAAIEAHIADPETCGRYLMPGHVIGRIEARRRAEAERRKNSTQLLAIEAAKNDAATRAADEAKRAARAAYDLVIAQRTAACGECDDQAHVLLEGKPTRERCTHPNIRRSA